MATICKDIVLKGKIEWVRRRMHVKAERYGLTDHRTVLCSQKLDHLLNQYQKECVREFVNHYEKAMKPR